MRKIKFRIFNDGKMIYPIGQDYVIRFDGVVGEFNGQTYDTVKNPKVMQFTGLTDRHGNGIYQGDIIHSKFSNGADCNHVIEWREDHSGFVARFVTDEFGNIFTQGWINEYAKEVIGNIYQNPELLTQGK